jgi:hypothetical protein
METADVGKGSGDLFGTHPAVNNLLYSVHSRSKVGPKKPRVSVLYRQGRWISEQLTDEELLCHAISLF